jgi:hypothetical protein
MSVTDHPVSAAERPSRLGLPLPGLIGLALLAVPRVVLHDLGIIHEGSFINLLFVFVPPLIWVAFIVARKIPRPFLTTVVIGVIYGVFLALIHQLLWHQSMAGQSVQLGGNLADLAPGLQQLILRGAAVVSSLVTGTMVGVITGAVALLVSRVRARVRRS